MSTVIHENYYGLAFTRIWYGHSLASCGYGLASYGIWSHVHPGIHGRRGNSAGGALFLSLVLHVFGCHTIKSLGRYNPEPSVV